jgi:hypothetical protein
MHHEEIKLNFDAVCQQILRFGVRNLVGSSQYAYTLGIAFLTILQWCIFTCSTHIIYKSKIISLLRGGFLLFAASPFEPMAFRKSQKFLL